MGRVDQLEAVIFDLDDTLIHWEPRPEAPRIEPYRPYLQQALGFARLRWPSLELSLDAFAEAVDWTLQQTIEEAVATIACVPFDEILERTFAGLGFSLDDQAMAELLDACVWRLDPRESLEPNAERVLRSLRKAGYKLGIITNAVLLGEMRSNELESLGIREYFDAVVTSGDARRFKPHPEIFEYTLARLGCEPDRALMVGDSLRDDVRAAAAAGLSSIWYSPAGKDELALTPAPHERVIGDLTELLDLLV